MCNKLMFATLFFVACGCTHVAPPSPSGSDDSWLDDWKSKHEGDNPAADTRPASKAASSASPRTKVAEIDESVRGQNAELRKAAAQLAAENRKLAAQVAEATKKGWTGALIYSWQSGCVPCERLKHDIAARKGWKVGRTNDCHFKIVFAGQDTAVPLIVYLVDGKEVGRILGYDGSITQLNVILAKHPKCAPDLRGTRTESALDAPAGNEAYENPLYSWEYYGAFADVGSDALPVVSSVPFAPRPAVPYRSSVSWSVLGIPLVTHTHQGACY